jgi:flagellar basal-body rod protein FlgF
VLRSLNTAEQAMSRQQVRIDALANNLANVNTTGFRAIMTRVAEEGAIETVAKNMEGGLAEGGEQQPNALQKPRQGTGNWMPTEPLELYHATDTRGGPVTATGRETDVALLSRGFFAIETPAGERYTRGGSFTIDELRQLTTPDGLPVLGTGGPIILQGENFSIEPDGRVLVDGAVVGQFKVVDFGDPSRLEHEGGNLLRAPANLEAQNVPAEEIEVAQGHLEGSNVNSIDTLVAMIEAQRAFEMQSKVLTTEDQMLAKSVNDLARPTA